MQALGEPVVGGAPDRVVRLRPDARFDVAVERFEPVLDDGLGLAGDFAADPLAVCVVSEADHSAPAAVAVPVPVAVTARRIVLEEDPVRASRVVNSWDHDSKNGGHSGGQLPALQSFSQLCPATYSQLEEYM